MLPASCSAERKNMKINSKDFQVREGDEVDLGKRPTLIAPVYDSKDQYQKLLGEHVAQLSSLQQLIYASNRYAILLIFQAMDAAGKDGAIKHVMSGVNPQGCQVFSFKHPSPTELQHDFLWRTTRDLPERGRIGIFNRSYYEEVLIVRVHPEILRSEGLPDTPAGKKAVWHDRYRSIANLERHLHDNGTRIIKFYLHLSKEEQRRRFLQRIDEPVKAGQELEIQPGRYRGAEILETLHEGLPGMSGRDQHGERTLVRGSRRRQGECAADRLADHPRYVRRPRDGLSQSRRQAPAGIAGDSQATRQVRDHIGRSAPPPGAAHGSSSVAS
jgi:PPK2 family polyphosphate:nucleotide phosphotransferase